MRRELGATQEIQRTRRGSQILGGCQIFQADGSLKSDVAGIFISQKSTNSTNPGFNSFQRASLAAHGYRKYWWEERKLRNQHV